MWEALASGIGERGDGAVAQPHHHDSADLLAVHDPPAPAVARMRELQGGFPGSEIKIGTCDKTT